MVEGQHGRGTTWVAWRSGAETRHCGDEATLHPLHKILSPAAVMNREKKITLMIHSMKIKEVILLLVDVSSFYFTEQSDLMMKLCLKLHRDKLHVSQ